MMSDASGWNWQMPRTWGRMQRPQFGSVFLPYEHFSQMSNYPQNVAPQQAFTQEDPRSNRKIWTA